MTMPISAGLSNRIPAEIWQELAAWTVPPYDIVIPSGIKQGKTQEYFWLYSNDPTIVRPMHLATVSRSFYAGVDDGLKKQFRGLLRSLSNSSNRHILGLLVAASAACMITDVSIKFNPHLLFDRWCMEDLTLQNFPNLKRLTIQVWDQYPRAAECRAGEYGDILRKSQEISSCLFGGVRSFRPQGFKIYITFIWFTDSQPTVAIIDVTTKPKVVESEPYRIDIARDKITVAQFLHLMTDYEIPCSTKVTP